MDITPLLSANALPVRRYGPAGFTVGEGEYAGSILITPHGVEELLGDADRQIESAIQKVMTLPGIELLLIGTGAETTYVEDTLRQSLRAKSIASEVMNTGAACRTYNVLLAEGRKVAAILVLPR